jgi:hypothetical protein
MTLGGRERFPRLQTGVAVVSNTTTGAGGIEGIEFHLLDPGRGLASLRVETLVDGTILDIRLSASTFSITGKRSKFLGKETPSPS